MYLDAYPTIMATLATAIAVLSLLLAVLGRKPRGRRIALRRARGLDQPGQGGRERDVIPIRRGREGPLAGRPEPVRSRSVLVP